MDQAKRRVVASLIRNAIQDASLIRHMQYFGNECESFCAADKGGLLGLVVGGIHGISARKILWTIFAFQAESSALVLRVLRHAARRSGRSIPVDRSQNFGRRFLVDMRTGPRLRSRSFDGSRFCLNWLQYDA